MTTGRRVHERFQCELPVTVIHGEEELSGIASNISLGGLYIVTDVKVPFGMDVKVRFQVPSLKEPATVSSKVRWVKPDGFGVQFGSLRALEVWALNQYFKSLEAQPDPE